MTGLYDLPAFQLHGTLFSSYLFRKKKTSTFVDVFTGEGGI